MNCLLVTLDINFYVFAQSSYDNVVFQPGMITESLLYCMSLV